MTLYSIPRERKTCRSRTSRPTTSQRGRPAESRCSFHTRRPSEEASSRLSASSQYWISARPPAYFKECRKGLCSFSRRNALRTIRGSTSSPATVTVTCHSLLGSINNTTPSRPHRNRSPPTGVVVPSPEGTTGRRAQSRALYQRPTGIPSKTCSTARQQDQVVTVHDLPLVRRAELARQVAGGPPDQPGELAGVVVDQAPRDRHPVRVDEVDGVPTDERAGDRGDPGGQQGRAPLGERPYRAGIEHD